MQFVLLVHVAVTTAADKGTGPLGVVRIDSVTAYAALEDPDVMMAVIDHMPNTALLTDHRLSFVFVGYRFSSVAYGVTCND